MLAVQRTNMCAACLSIHKDLFTDKRRKIIFYFSVSYYAAKNKNIYSIDCKTSFVYLHNPVTMAVFFFQLLLNDGYPSAPNLKLCTVCKGRCVFYRLSKQS